MSKKLPKIWIKSLAFLAAFLILHYAYDFLPIAPIEWISGVNESFFQHQKIAFFAYLFLSMGEYVIVRKRGAYIENFVTTRLFSAVTLPWIIFILWYTAPAYYGQFTNLVVEIAYANIITIAAVAFCIIIERNLEKAPLDNSFKTIVVILFLVSVSLYVIFTYKLPWTDVFVDPTIGAGS